MIEIYLAYLILCLAYAFIVPLVFMITLHYAPTGIFKVDYISALKLFHTICGVIILILCACASIVWAVSVVFK